MARFQLLSWACAALLFGLLGGSVDGQDDVVTLRVLASGLQQEPSVASGSFCAGVFQVDTVANTVEYRIVLSALASGELGSFIHGPADPGDPGPILHTLPSGSVKVGTWSYDEALEADILAGRTYVDVHSNALVDGELRGQIVDLVCTIDSDQTIPLATSPATGYGLFQIDIGANLLDYHIVYEPLLASGEFAAHIHVPGGIGDFQVGTRPHTLPAGPLKVGSWDFPEDMQDDLFEGRGYVLVHSAAFPGGEIRGQVISSLSVLDGQQEVPSVSTDAVGYALLSIDRTTSTLGHDIVVTGLTGTEIAAAIHGPAPEGMEAPELVTLPLGARKLGKVVVAPAVLQHLADGLLYVSIRTDAFPDGELRGQLQPFAGPPPPPVPQFVRGDCNADAGYDIGDPIALLGFLFPNPPPPTPLVCADACDCNDDGTADIADAICLLTGLFGSPAVPPEPPHGGCGFDPTADMLGCDAFSPCP